MRMKDRLDTYALWDALKADSECPLCALRRKTERQLIERSLGGSVMSPDDRQRVNAAGYCQHHHRQLFARKNRLGHALLTLSRLQSLIPQADQALQDLKRGNGHKGPRFFRRGSAETASENGLTALTARCVLCQELETQSTWQTETLLYLWEKDPEFRAAFSASKGLCLPDTARVMGLWGKLPATHRQSLLETLRNGLMESLARLEQELSWYTQKFDYRNQDAPWGASKDALERTVNKLRGWCLGPEPLNDDAR